MKIKTVRRQEGQFKDVLGRLRDGKNTEEDGYILTPTVQLKIFLWKNGHLFNLAI